MNTSFTKNQLRRWANIFDNAGQVLLATVVLPPFISEVENKNNPVLLLGIILTLGSWWLSLRIERKIDQ